MNSPVTKPLHASNSKVELKLLINKKEQKVLFAEANKEFVDFLFSLMSLPLGMVIKLLAEKEMVGSIRDLYNSIKSLNESYYQSSKILDSILNPMPPLLAFKSPLLLTNTERVKRKAYMCPHGEQGNNRFSGKVMHNFHGYVADDPNTLCPDCMKKMDFEVQFAGMDCAEQGSSSGGFVKGWVTYMVMDNLEVKPSSTISAIALLNSFNVQDLSSLEEMVVYVGAAEGLKLLEESLKSKNVLTSVFLTRRSKRMI